MTEFPRQVVRNALSCFKIGRPVRDSGSSVACHSKKRRIAKQIGSSLEAKVTLKASGKTLELLREYEDELRYVFIVSQVELTEGDSELWTTVSNAEGQKCERCWNYSTDVGESAKFPTVCERCVAALEEIEREIGFLCVSLCSLVSPR